MSICRWRAQYPHFFGLSFSSEPFLSSPAPGVFHYYFVYLLSSSTLPYSLSETPVAPTPHMCLHIWAWLGKKSGSFADWPLNLWFITPRGPLVLTCSTKTLPSFFFTPTFLISYLLLSLKPATYSSPSLLSVYILAFNLITEIEIVRKEPPNATTTKSASLPRRVILCIYSH